MKNLCVCVCAYVRILVIKMVVEETIFYYFLYCEYILAEDFEATKNKY